jgi:copper chaperone CopZ
MKRIKLIVVICGIILFNILHSNAQDSKYTTSQFHVKGVCDQCKIRIENAAYIKGVKHCEWNHDNGIITVVYDSAKVELIKIHESIASVGHETDKVPADPEAYKKLPKCCAYDDEGVHNH